MAKKRSPWFWVGIGCLTVVLLMGACVVGVGFMGFRFAKQLEQEISDPVLRAEKAREVLGCEALPAGYNPMISITIPFILEMTILSTQEPDEDGQIRGIDERGFIYFKFLKIADASKIIPRRFFPASFCFIVHLHSYNAP